MFRPQLHNVQSKAKYCFEGFHTHTVLLLLLPLLLLLHLDIIKVFYIRQLMHSELS
jgi:hypothetical protein